MIILPLLQLFLYRYSRKCSTKGLKRYFVFFNNVLYVALSQIILELPGTIALFIKWIAFIYFLKSHFDPNKKKSKIQIWKYCNGISLSHTTSEKKHVLGLKNYNLAQLLWDINWCSLIHALAFSGGLISTVPEKSLGRFLFWWTFLDRVTLQQFYKKVLIFYCVLCLFYHYSLYFSANSNDIFYIS